MKVERDVVYWQTLRMQEAGLRVVLMSHDEAVLLARVSEAEATLAEAIKWMQTPPPWAEGLPLGVTWHITDTYKK